MKKSVLLLVYVCMISFHGFSQLSGIKNIPGDYATIALAITDLNLVGVAAPGVTFNVVAGNPETAPTGGYIIGGSGSLVLTTAINLNTQIVFQGNGNIITAPTPQTAGALNDAIFKIIGGDFITIDGFQLMENVANTTTTAGSNNMTEWGIALLYVTSTNGAQNNTIQNCTIDLDRTYQNTFGIYCNSTHTATAVTASATATTTAGGNSGLKIYSNTITDVNMGIVVVGPTAAADNNDVLEIGKSAFGNIISNFGTTGTFSGYANVSGSVNGILVRNTKNFSISYNSITSSNGGVTAGTLNGIQMPVFSNSPTGTFTNSINNNSLSLKSGVITGIINGINILGTSATATSTININNNDFNNFGHTVAGTANITFILQAGTHQIQNINNNTFTNISVNTTGNIIFISNSVSLSATGVQSVSNNSIVTAFNKTGAGGTVTLFTSNASSVAGSIVTQNNNNFSNITVIGTTIIAGWSNTDGGAPTKTISGNTFNNWSCGSGSITALTVSFSGSGNVFNNTISNITSSSNITGISSASGTQNFYQNTIFNLSSTGASTVVGFSITGGTLNHLYKNSIYNLQTDNASGLVNGITVSSGTVYLSNNLISDLKTPSATGINAINGINITGGTTVGAYYNSIYLTGTSSGSGFGSSGVYATATPTTIDFRNNIIVNNSTPTGTGISVSFRKSSTSLTNYSSNSNNNCFYAGTPSTTNLIFYDGTNADQTISAFKTRMVTRDAASFSELPPFANVTAAPFDLHLQTTIATQCESGGTPVTVPIAVAVDYDNEARNASLPDVGADEGSFTLMDLTPPVILYTALLNTSSTSNRSLAVTINDVSGISIDANQPVLYWKINSGSYTGPIAPSSIVGNVYTYDFGTGVVTGDIVSYFIVAQDAAATPNVISFPSVGASVTSNPPLASVGPTTPSTYTIISSICGTKTVGISGDYTTLTAAITDLNNKEITCPVVFSLIDATYPSETFPMVINSNTGSSVVNTVTIKPETGVNAVISSTTASAIFKLNGADYIIIDGSNNGTNSMNLTVTNTNTALSTAIWIGSQSSVDGAIFNTIKNCNINGSSPTTTTAGIILGSGTTMGNAAESANSNNIIQNNNFTAFQNGVFHSGAATLDQNISITNNIFGSTISASKLGYRGIILQNAQNFSVSDNTINGVVTSTTSTTTGIQIGGTINGGLIEKNKISDIKNTNTGGYGTNGINLAASSTASNIIVKNNFIWDVAAYGYAGNTIADNGYGIIAVSGGGYNIYNNSINLNTNQTATTGLPAAINITSGIITASSIDIRNNIFANNQTVGTQRYSIYSGAANTVYSDINFNNYFTSGANLGYLVANVLDLTAWKTATGKDVNSSSGDPEFETATDLHIKTTLVSPVNDAGTQIVSVTDDIDGDVRNNPSDIGADEFILILCAGTPAASTINGAATVCANTGTDLSLSTLYPEVGITYQWASSVNLGGPYITLLGTSATQATGNLAATTYYICTITCTNSGLFYTTSEKTVAVISLPTAIISSNSPICAGLVLNLTGTSDIGTSFNWIGPDGFTSTNQNPSISSATIAASGNYSFISVANGCSSLAGTANITVNPVPATVTASASTSTVCDAITPFDLFSSSINIQTDTYINPYGDGGFETGSTFALNNWNVVNGVNNIWSVGISAGVQDGTNSALIGTNFVGTGNASVNHFYRDIAIPAGATNINLKFYLKMLNPDDTYDYFNIYTTTTANTPVSGTLPGAGYTSVFSNTTTEYPTYILQTVIIPDVLAGTTVRFVFTYKCDGVAPYTVSAVDNISLLADITLTPTYTWTSVPTGYNSAIQNPTGVTQSVTTQYFVKVENVYTCFDTASVTVTNVTNAAITVQPLPDTKCSGQTAVFTVTATGPSLTYQWRKNSVNINTISNPSAATDTLTLVNVSLSDADNYDVVISAACGAPVTSNAVTLTVNPVPTASASSNSPVCAGSTLNFTGTTDIGTVFLWTGPSTFSSTLQNPSISTAALPASGTYFFSVSVNGCTSIVSSTVVSVNQLPDAVTVSPATSTNCVGGVQQLDASGGNLTGVTLLSENFNSATNLWTTINNSIGGSDSSLAAWKLRPDAYVYTTYGTWHSNDNSQFYLSNSDEPGSGVSTSTILQSPSFSTLDFSTASVSFYHYFNWYSQSAKVDYSLDGTIWTNLKTYTVDAGATGAFVQDNILLPVGALNQASVYIRFKYDAGWDYFWGIDNVSITGTQSVPITWTPTTDLFIDAFATTPYTGTALTTVYAQPSIGTATYTATATTTANCTSSNTADVIVSSPLVGGTATPSTTSVCTGSGTSITLAGNTGNIQWQSSPDGTTWSDISGETSATLSTGTITVPTHYQALVSSNGCASATSNAIIIAIDPVSEGGTVTGGATICSGSNSPLLTLGAHTGIIVRWESSIDGGSNWSAIANTTTTYTSGALTSTTQFRAVVKSGACSESNSTSTIVTVDQVSDGGTLSGGTTLCSATNSTVLILTGYIGSILGWESSTDGGTIWTPISNTVNTYPANNISVGTDFRVIVQNGVCTPTYSTETNFTVNTPPVATITGYIDPLACGASNGTATVNVAASYTWSTTPTQTTQTAIGLVAGTYFVTISDGVCTGSTSVTLTDPGAPVVTLYSDDTTICAGSSITFTAGGATDYEFFVNGFSQGSPSVVNTFTSILLANSDIVTVSGVTAGCTGNSTGITMVVSPVSAGGILGGAATVCAGSNTTTLTLNSFTGNIVRWESSPDGSVWSPIAQTTNSYVVNNLISTTYYRVVVQSGVCNEVNSSEAIITVDPISVGGIVNDGATVCTGTGTTLTLIGNTGIIQWQSSLDGLIWSDLSGETSVTLSTGNLTVTTYYQAIVTSGVCSSSISVSDTVFVSPISDGGTVNSDTTVCYGTNSTLLTLSGNIGNVVNWQSSSDGTVWSDIANTAISYTASDLIETTHFRAVVQNSVCGSANSIPAIVTVDPLPAGVTANVSQNIICIGSTVDLMATPASGNFTLLSEDFNGTTNNWTTTNTSTGGTPALADWTLQADAYVYSSTTFHSNDSSQFYLSNSDDQGSGGTTATTLESPSFSTLGLSSLSLSFNHYYRSYAGSSGSVEVWNGIVWTPVVIHTFTIGTASAFVEDTIDLSSYLDLTSVKIRFKYDASWGYYWAIDNVSIMGVNPNYTYDWTSVPVGFTSSVQNPAGLTPTVATLYNVVVTSSAGCASMASVNVNVNPLPTGNIAISGTSLICSGDSTQLALTFTGTAPWTVTADDGSGQQIFNIPISSVTTWINPVDTTVYTLISVTDGNNCTTLVNQSDTVNVLASPVANLAAPDTLCFDTGESVSLDAGNVGATYVWSDGSTLQTLFVEAAVVGIGTHVYYVTVTNNNCSNVDSISIIVDICSGVLVNESSVSISIYPNPTKGDVNIVATGLGKESVITLVNVIGQIIFEEKIDVPDFSKNIDLSIYPKGIYFVKITNNKAAKIERIIFQ